MLKGPITKKKEVTQGTKPSQDQENIPRDSQVPSLAETKGKFPEMGPLAQQVAGPLPPADVLPKGEPVIKVETPIQPEVKSSAPVFQGSTKSQGQPTKPQSSSMFP